MARVSTHVLDTAQGRPAAGIAISLHRLTRDGRHLCASATTNADGRTDQPLLAGNALQTGEYELIFAAGAYFRHHGFSLPEPPFLDEIVIRFGISDPTGQYHVPLLLSPYGYSTYRGS